MIAHAAATVGLALIALGYLLRYRLPLHVLCMLSAALTDYGVLIGLEIARGPAIRQALAAPGPLLTFHVAVSVLALLCYPTLVVLGAGAVRRHPGWLPAHRRLARAFLLFRLANYVTSWLV